MSTAFLRAAALALALGFPLAAGAETPASPAAGDPVVARVNGTEIHRTEVTAAIATLPEQYRQLPADMLFASILGQMIDRQLLSTAAEQAKLGDDAEVKKRLAQARDRVLQEVYLTREVEKGLTDERLKAQYQKMLKDQPAGEEVHARHILVDSEDKAKALIAKLEKGESFEELAKANSTGPSANNGGDLGYFSKEQMVPEFADAAFAMKPGEVSKVPVKTQFGWHIIKVEDRRTTPPPKFEDTREELRKQVAQELVTDLIAKLRKGAKVEQFNADGSPMVPEAKAPAAPAKQ